MVYLVSVPYRGATFLNYIWKLGRISYRVSVPYRGATFLNTDKSYNDTFEIMFPSPIGELHFSINQKFIKKIGGPFPSPIGELHFSIAWPSLLICRDSFPSPIGELHFSIMIDFLTGIVYLFPSPIGELHFSIGIAKKPIVDATATVSVPYRGATFLNRDYQTYHIPDKTFPSPIGELHFSIMKKKWDDYEDTSFPSPIGELHFSIVIYTDNRMR